MVSILKIGARSQESGEVDFHSLIVSVSIWRLFRLGVVISIFTQLLYKE
jgi:hypothetical protein